MLTVLSYTSNDQLFRILLHTQNDSVRGRSVGVLLRLYRRCLLLFRVSLNFPPSLSLSLFPAREQR